ncbi:hypothetical protein [Myroides sp. DW712]|uniref:hypothetical protein n=1 Tax=Myroides sp. DW712 TaxID=3389800 RepID=UPI00397E3D89
MKHYILLAFMFLIGTSAFAQKTPTPEFTGRPYALENSTLSELERVDAQHEQKHKMLGYAGVEIYYTAFTPSSTVQFSKSKLPKFVISVEKGVDPSDAFTLIKGKVKKGKRSFLISTMQGTFTKAKSTNDVQVTLTYKKIKDNLYEIILPDNVETGEYAFVPNGTDEMSAGNKMKITCFGIE